jgi:AcrR family transcriptional regulator
MRALAEAAGASLSAANYHFGSKEALLEATLRRRVEPVNALRLERLAELERETASPGLDEVLEAFLRPIFEVRAASESAESRPAWVGARLYSDPSESVRRLNAELFRELNERFLDAFERALPGCDRGDLQVAQQLTTGLLVHVLSGHVSAAPEAIASKPSEARKRAAEEPAYAAILSALLDYAAAGFRSTAGSR